MSVDKPQNASKQAADDPPMDIVSAASNEGNTAITVTWTAVSYPANKVDAYAVSIICKGYSKDNFVQPDLAATSLNCPYTMEEGRTYETFVVPTYKGNAVAKWQSPRVPIPYP
jgi:hypothetical protein